MIPGISNNSYYSTIFPPTQRAIVGKDEYVLAGFATDADVILYLMFLAAPVLVQQAIPKQNDLFLIDFIYASAPAIVNEGYHYSFNNE
jgi:hypothetical protein